MEIKEYIESGALEAYILGSASDQEIDKLLSLKAQYPEVNDALNALEGDLERMARNMAINPPPGTWMRIEKGGSAKIESAEGDFLEVHGPSSHMRVHKIWRWILAAIFVLGKVFLGFAIFYYLESKQAHEQITELKQQLKQAQQK